jgi:MarR family transcriptional regulator, organic hydroperoxide resistance regulator
MFAEYKMFRDSIKFFPQFIKKVLHEYDASKLKLDINKTQINILMHIYENDDKSMSEIGLMTGLEKSSFTRSADYLVKKGFIIRNLPENDRRKIKLSLTDTGIKAAELIKEDFTIYLNSLISEFPANEKEEFFESLKTVSKYMNKIIDLNTKQNLRKKGI